MNEGLPYRPNVGLCLINSEGKIFAGRRIDMPSEAWQMPQGGVDARETPRHAAMRELGEETGITSSLVELLEESRLWIRYDLPPELVGRFWGGKFRGQRQKWFAYRFLGKDSDVHINTDHAEFSEWQWKTKDELIAAIVPFKKDIYEQVFYMFGKYLA